MIELINLLFYIISICKYPCVFARFLEFSLTHVEIVSKQETIKDSLKTFLCYIASFVYKCP